MFEGGSKAPAKPERLIMKSLTPILTSVAVAGALLCATGAANAGVNVRFANPESYADLPFPADERARVLNGLTKHFEKLGAKLPSGQDLEVEVIDLDLAGRVEPSYGRGQDMRILRDQADWPSMRLRYTLRSGGEVVGNGEEKLNNMIYLGRANRHDRNDALRYEKQMIDEWFKEKIAPGRKG
jgi:hypothetical protein